MPGPYSMDLRERIFASHQEGKSCRQISEIYGVSPSCAVKLATRQRQAGTIEPDTLGRPRGSGKLEPYRDFLIDTVTAQADITMPELAACLEEVHGIVAHPASLSRFLCKAGFTYKKNADRSRTPASGRRQTTP